METAILGIDYNESRINGFDYLEGHTRAWLTLGILTVFM